MSLSPTFKLSLNSLASDRVRRLSREGLWVIGGQIATVAGSLVGVRVLTGLVDSVSYGQIALGLTLVNLVNQTVIGPLGNGINRFYAPSIEEGDRIGYLRAVRRLVAQSSALILFFMLAAIVYIFATHHSGWATIAAASFGLALLSGYNSVLSGILNAARRRLAASIHQGLEPFGRFMGASALIMLLGPRAVYALIGYCAGVSLVLSSQYLVARPLLRTESTSTNSTGGAWRKQIVDFSSPFATWGLFTWAQQASDRWALEFFASTHEVGLYAIVFQLGYYPLALVSSMMMQFVAPIFYQRAGFATDKHRTANLTMLALRLTWCTLVVTGLAFVIALFLHEQIFRLLVAMRYREVSYLLPWIVLSGGLFAAGQTIALTLMSQMRPHAMTVAKIGTALLGIALNVVGAKQFGLVGVVAANVVFSASYLLWLAALVRPKTVDTIPPGAG